MKLRATLGAYALVLSAAVVMPATAQAGHDHEHRLVRKHVHDAVHRVASVVLCPLEWFRHRHHHAEKAYTPAPKKVVYAKKAYAKKVAYAKPLK
jgi:hypothetical protein